MGELIEKEIFHKIKEDLEVAISNLFSYLDQIENGDPSGVMEVNRANLTRLSNNVKHHVNELAKIQKVK